MAKRSRLRRALSRPILDRRAGFFAALSAIYLVVLGVLLLARQFHWLGVNKLQARMGGIIPLAIPWFGALGAVTASLYGVFDHSGECSDHRHKWDCSYNYWHLLRPLMGAVLGTLSFLIFVGFVNATTAGTSGASRLPTTAEQAIPYLVIAFVVGYREDTFRKLIKTIIDTILGPGIPGVTPPAGIAISPSPVNFDKVAVGASTRQLVTVSNTGTGNLVVHGAKDTPPGVSQPKNPEQFWIENDTVSGAVIPPGGQATMSVVFKPSDLPPVADDITITSNAGARTVQLSGEGTPANGSPVGGSGSPPSPGGVSSEKSIGLVDPPASPVELAADPGTTLSIQVRIVPPTEKVTAVIKSGDEDGSLVDSGSGGYVYTRGSNPDDAVTLHFELATDPSKAVDLQITKSA